MIKKLPYSILLLLAGCSSYSTDFDCGVGKGMPCSSLYRIDHAVSKGEIDFELEEDSQKNPNTKSTVLSNNGNPKLIWVAPRTDTNGIRHGEKLLQTRD